MCEQVRASQQALAAPIDLVTAHPQLPPDHQHAVSCPNPHYSFAVLLRAQQALVLWLRLEPEAGGGSYAAIQTGLGWTKHTRWRRKLAPAGSCDEMTAGRNQRICSTSSGQGCYSQRLWPWFSCCCTFHSLGFSAATALLVEDPDSVRGQQTSNRACTSCI